MNRPIHFEIHAEDLERAAKFYTAVFGWEVKEWPVPGQDPYLGIVTGPEGTPGINGGFIKRRGSAPMEGEAVNAYVCTMDVESIEETAKKIETAGGTLALPKFAIPGMAWQAYYKDTEGNIFGIHQADKEAK